LGTSGCPHGEPCKGLGVMQRPPEGSGVGGRLGEGEVMGRGGRQGGHSCEGEPGDSSGCPGGRWLPKAPRGEQEPVGVPGAATAVTAATHPGDAAVVPVRPAPSKAGACGLLGFRHPFPFPRTHCRSQPVPVPRGPMPCSLPFPGHSSPLVPQPPPPTLATRLYTQLRNKLPLSHPAWPAWLRSVPEVAWAHVAHGHLLLLLYVCHPGPQGSALLRARVMVSWFPRVCPASCQGDSILVPKGLPCSVGE